MAAKTISQYAYPDLVVGDQDYRWCHRYAHDVVNGAIIAGKWIRLACKRHLDDLERNDVHFDIVSAKSVVKWFKFVPITDGVNVGKPTILLPWQIWVVCCLMAWKNTATGFRKYKSAYVQVGRKNGKSTLAGGLTLYMMYKAPFKPRTYSVATKKDQAKELWSAAHTMVKLSPRLKQQFLARTNDILMPAKEGYFKPLASDSDSLDGLNPTMVNLDECHAIKKRNLYDVMVSAFGAQDEGLMLTITTAGTILDGLCTTLNSNGKQVLELGLEQDSYFYAIYEIDTDDKKDWQKEKVWYKANPGLGYQPRLTYMHEQSLESGMSSEQKINFLTKHLNIFVSGYDKWLEMDEVYKCKFDKTYSDYAGRKCYVGIDRSKNDDLTSMCMMFPNDLFTASDGSETKEGGVDCFYINLLPRATVEKSTDLLKKTYMKAIENGNLQLVDSATILNRHIDSIVEWAITNFDVEMIGYDPWHMSELAIEWEDKQYPVVAVSQGTGNMSEPAKKLEGLIKESTFRYNGFLFEFAAQCAMSKITDQNNMKIVKDSAKTDKIDPIIATIIALSCATLQKPVDENPYDKRGLICV